MEIEDLVSLMISLLLKSMIFDIQVVQIYLSGNQQKRNISGAGTVIHRDAHMGLLSQQAFLDFLQKIRVSVCDPLL